jgi:peptide/nickel transport system permease protein
MATTTEILRPQTQWQETSRFRRISKFVSRILRTRGAGFGLFVLVFFVVVAATADIAAPYHPNDVHSAGILQPPSTTHLFGTDHIGRDVLSRIMHGGRVAMIAGLYAVAVATIAGVSIGLFAGYVGGLVDDILMRLMDGFYSFPTLILALAIAASLGPGLNNTLLAIGIVLTPVFARLVRGQVLSVKERDFVLAARVLGANPLRIIFLHILPNVTAPIIVQISLMVAAAIIYEASLSFLGLGVPPPQASWGSMLRQSYQYMRHAPWLSLFPGVAIFITVLGLNMLGDGLRVALDPRLRERGA